MTSFNSKVVLSSLLMILPYPEREFIGINSVYSKFKERNIFLTVNGTQLCNMER